MSSLKAILKLRFKAAFAKVLPPEMMGADPILRVTEDVRHGDFQCNAAMSLAKVLKQNPKVLAESILAVLDVDDICDQPQIAGPGFINLRFKPAFLAGQVALTAGDIRLGVPLANPLIKHFVDFSSPNLAKEMHIGHLRTTITGDVIARVAEFLGHPVERINHVGDWGTQFGMLLEYLEEAEPGVIAHPETFAIADLEGFYRAAKTRFDADVAFADRARAQVVRLQAGEASALTLWQVFVKASLAHCHELYALLDIRLNDIGESYYNDKLPEIVSELMAKGIAKENQGAICVFLDGFVNREGEPLPMIIRKSDGGYNYDTTDLAALKYRTQDCGAQRLIYVTDVRQAQHFAQVFAAARQAGWAHEPIHLEHIGYGMILGEDRRPFKTRDGNTVRLKAVLEEAIQRAKVLMTTSATANPDKNLSIQATEAVARAVGIAAVKYFDLSHSLSSDYVFSWEAMLAMEGNTGPYMLYAYARICSIARKAGVDLETLAIPKTPIFLHPSELALAKLALGFSDIIADVAMTLKPNLLTDYLYNLAKVFNTFYDRKTGVKVLDKSDPDIFASRLMLCQLTARALKTGLNLLGISVVDQM